MNIDNEKICTRGGISTSRKASPCTYTYKVPNMYRGRQGEAQEARGGNSTYRTHISMYVHTHIEPFIITSGKNVFVCFLQVQSITYQLLEQGTKLLKEN